MNHNPKNLLFIMTDQQRYDALACTGNPLIQTPHLDRLAQGGARFTTACSSCPVCGPQRASMHTGRSLRNTGVRRNDDAAETVLAEDAPIRHLKTYDEILTERGYIAEYHGKWHMPPTRAHAYRNRPIGHTEEEPHPDLGMGMEAQYRQYLDQHVPTRPLQPGERIDRFTGRPYRPDPIDAGYGLEEPSVPRSTTGEPRRYTQPDYIGVSTGIPAEHSNTAFWAKQTLASLKRLAGEDQPFALTCSFHYPHSPIIAVEPYTSMYNPADMPIPASIGDRMNDTPYEFANGRMDLPRFRDPDLIKFMVARYYALVTEIDHWVGQILDELERLGLESDTLVVFTSDHGEMLGEHGTREKNIFLEGSVRVPLILSMPGRIPPGTVVEQPVSLLDLFNTVLDVCDQTDPASDGHSLLPLIDGEPHASNPDYAIAEWDWRGDTEANFMVRTRDAKMITTYSPTSTVPDALYNLTEDPGERTNLAKLVAEDPWARETWGELSGRLLEWLDRVDSPHQQGVADRLESLRRE